MKDFLIMIKGKDVNYKFRADAFSINQDTEDYKKPNDEWVYKRPIGKRYVKFEWNKAEYTPPIMYRFRKILKLFFGGK